MPPNTILFAGDIFDGRDAGHPLAQLRDGSTATVRIWERPARHHLELFQLLHVGREAELIERCAELRVSNSELPSSPSAWTPVDAAWVDNLTPASHALLAAAADALNFAGVIATLQRQITRGQNLEPVSKAMTKQLLAPIKREFDSWMSSLTTQLSSALAATPPSTKP